MAPFLKCGSLLSMTVLYEYQKSYIIISYGNEKKTFDHQNIYWWLAVPCARFYLSNKDLKETCYNNILDHFSCLFAHFHRNNSYNITFTFSSVFWSLCDTQYFWFFLLVCTKIDQKVFRRMRKPHTVVHARSMDFPNLDFTIVAIVPVVCWW